MVNSRLICVAILLSAGLGCSTTTVSGTFPPTPPGKSEPARLFIVPAGSVRNVSTGNEGFSFADAQRIVNELVLAVAREKDPRAEMTPGGVDATPYARAHGGTYLLIPTIVEWRQMRSDDPVGAFVEPHNRVAIELRLVRLDSTTTEGDVTFTNHARVTMNQPADRLLGDEFRKVVRRLLGE